jgi:acetyltransferase-like isoleucine patch superfamily enzyme
MALMKVEVSIDGGTPESRELYGRVQRAMGLTERLNRIPYGDREAIRQAWIELTGTGVDEAFDLIPPLYCDHGLNIRVGRNVFINQACMLNDIGGIEIGDDVMISPRVSLLTAGHPLEPGRRRRQIVAAPIAIERNVWLGAGATVLQGVTIGSDAVVAAGAILTRDVPPRTLVAGVPARVLREIDAEAEDAGPPAGGAH